MEQRISLVTLGVHDLAESRAFYARLGWRESSAGNDSVAFFQMGPIALGLFGIRDLAVDAGLPLESIAGPISGFRGASISVNVREKADVDQMIEEARIAGARILRPAEDAFWGGRTAYFADPDGHVWEIAWNPHFALDEDGRLTLPA